MQIKIPSCFNDGALKNKKMKKKLSQNQQSKTEEKTHSIYVIVYRIINRMFAMCVCV